MISFHIADSYDFVCTFQRFLDVTCIFWFKSSNYTGWIQPLVSGIY